jgi:DNA replication protein DnaC
VLILDDFGMRELTARQADDLYELINERAGKSLVLTSNRSSVDWYPLFPTRSSPSPLDRLVNTSHQIFMNGRHPGARRRPTARRAVFVPAVGGQNGLIMGYSVGVEN